jgi:uncharacterized protein YggE
MNMFCLNPTRAAMAVLAATIPLVGFPHAARGDDPMKHHTIAVSGKGKISARPDIAEVTAGVVTHAPSARDALAANNAATSRLFETLKERGIAEKDIQTSQISITPEYSQPQPRGYPAPPGANEQPAQTEFIPRLVGYKVENSVRVTSRRIDQLGPLLDAVVQAGANQLYGISFRVENPEELSDEARKRAMRDAKHKGELLAGEAGVVLGPPLKIAEQQQGGPGALPYDFEVPMPVAAAPRAPAMAVAAGEQELTVTVSVIYELRPPKQ